IWRFRHNADRCELPLLRVEPVRVNSFAAGFCGVRSNICDVLAPRGGLFRRLRPRRKKQWRGKKYQECEQTSRGLHKERILTLTLGLIGAQHCCRATLTATTSLLLPALPAGRRRRQGSRPLRAAAGALPEWNGPL